MRARRTILLATILVLPLRASSQGTVYPAGDGTTTVVKGREACGANPGDLNVVDAVTYDVISASEFAGLTPVVLGSFPNPMGRNVDRAFAGATGIVVANPTGATITVTQLEIDTAGLGLFNDVLGVQPAAGWTFVSSSLLRWTGSVDVTTNDTFDFIVRIEPTGADASAAPISISATTTAGLLTNTSHLTSERGDNSTPYVTLPFIEAGNEVFSASTSNGGSVETGQTKTFTVRVQETEDGNTQPIPAGSVLTIDVPAGWTDVTPLSSVGFGVAAVTAPSGCAAGSIVVATITPVLMSSIDFQFDATAPDSQGSAGLYTFEARIENGGLTPPISTRTELAQTVTAPPGGSSREGLLSAGAWVAVPDPMGHNRFTTWGAALANPTASTITVQEVLIEAVNGDTLFRSVQGVKPMSGWTRVSTSVVRWSGSLDVPPHSALDFVVRIQANSGSAASDPIRVTITDSTMTAYVNNDATTSQGGGEPSANLYYVVSGVPSVSVFGVGAGQPRQFQVVVEETQGSVLSGGAVLSVTVPMGWSAVNATAQPNFSSPVITQPTPTADGQIVTVLNPGLKGSKRTFRFEATAPPDLLDSLFVFDTTLTSAQVDSLCQAVVQVIDTTGGLEVQHLSPIVLDPIVNQIDLLFTAMSTPIASHRLEIFNTASSLWETLETRTLDAAAGVLHGAVTSNFGEYFDAGHRISARVASTSFHNQRLREDQGLFVISNYRVSPASVAPATAAQGRPDLPMLALDLSVDIGEVDLETMTVTAIGSDVQNDVALVRLFEDVDCSGTVDFGEGELVAGGLALDAASQVTFGTPGSPLVSFDDSQARCAILGIDVDIAATVGNLVALEVMTGFDLTSDVGPYPFPSVGGYPLFSTDVLITEQDTDGDGLTDAEELTRTGTIATDADTDDDGLLDGAELGGDGIYDVGIDTDPLVADTDGDGLADGLEEGVAPFISLIDTDGDLTPDVVDPDVDDPTIVGTDMTVFTPDLDGSTVTDALDDDTDDDGITDGNEDVDRNGRLDVVIGGSSSAGGGDTDPLGRDTDGDGLTDGLEIGLVTPQGSDTDPGWFVADADPATTTAPFDIDTDDDGIQDGVEDMNRDGARSAGELDPLDADTDDDALADGTEVGPEGVQDPGETSAFLLDTDGDGLQDGTERAAIIAIPDPDGPGPATATDPAVFIPDADPASQTDPLDDDSDDDGLMDGSEDANANGAAENTIGGTGTAGSGETDPTQRDSDGDGCQDGTESGLVAPEGGGTDVGRFVPDAVPAVTSDPLDVDTDDDGLLDGAEDADCDGGIDPGETDPSGDPSILRNDRIALRSATNQLKAGIFVGLGDSSLVLAGANLAPDPGEGPDPTLNGSDDDDDLYERRVSMPWSDADLVLDDAGRPLVFYQVTAPASVLYMVETAGSVRLEW